MTGPRREDDPLPAGEPQESPVPEANVVRIEDEIDAPAALLTRMRHAAEARGDGRLYGAAARRNPVLVAAGLLVGIGTRMGSGCTSGHGVCGVSRLSQRSMIATAWSTLPSRLRSSSPVSAPAASFAHSSAAVSPANKVRSVRSRSLPRSGRKPRCPVNITCHEAASRSLEP